MNISVNKLGKKSIFAKFKDLKKYSRVEGTYKLINIRRFTIYINSKDYSKNYGSALTPRIFCKTVIINPDAAMLEVD